MTAFHYKLRATWPGRPESAAEVADKFRRMITKLEDISPLFTNWILLAADHKTELSLSDLGDALDNWVEANVFKDDGEPFPARGFRLYAASNHGPAGYDLSRTPSLSVNAGSKFRNEIELDIGNMAVAADPKVIDSVVFEKVLLAVVSVWASTWGSVRLSRQLDLNPSFPPGPVPSRYSETGPWRLGWGMSWIAYLSAPRTRGLVVPYELETERLADGGMFLSTAVVRMDPDNPQHAALSMLLSDILEQRADDPIR
jgi:hypothetical protein